MYILDVYSSGSTSPGNSIPTSPGVCASQSEFFPSGGRYVAQIYILRIYRLPMAELVGCGTPCLL